MQLLGIDAGTSVVKAALFDRTGQTTGVAAQRNTLITPQPGYAELDMNATWQSAANAIRDVVTQNNVSPDSISAIGVTGNMVGAWPVDAHGKSLRNAIVHIDNRTQPWINARQTENPQFMRTIFASSGSAMQPGCTLPLIRWLAEYEPNTIERAQRILTCRGWLVYKLTGEAVIDASEATVLPGDTHKRDYSHAMFDLLEMAEHAQLLPPLYPATQIIGEVIPQAAEATGLRAGTPVVTGAGDVLTTSIGVGAASPGAAYSILGTAGINGLVTDTPLLQPPNVGLTFCQPGGNWVRVMVNVLGTPNLDWCIQQMFTDLVQQHGMTSALFENLEAKATTYESDGVIFLPYLSPTGTFAPFVDPNARGQFYGLTTDHTREQLLRAVYEGVALAIRDCFAAMPAPIDEIGLAGGGANSMFWSQLVADVTGKPIIVPEGTEFGARGAAILAGIGVGWFDTIHDLEVLVRRRHEPSHTSTYDARYETYRMLGQALRSVWG